MVPRLGLREEAKMAKRNYWLCPKCGNPTLYFEDKKGYVEIANCEFTECDYSHPGYPE